MVKQAQGNTLTEMITVLVAGKVTDEAMEISRVAKEVSDISSD